MLTQGSIGFNYILGMTLFTSYQLYEIITLTICPNGSMIGSSRNMAYDSA